VPAPRVDNEGLTPEVGLVTVLVVHACLAVAAGFLGRRLGRNVLLLVAAGPATAVAWIASVTADVVAGTTIETTAAWAPALGLTLDLRLDGFGLLFWWIIAVIGLLVMVYAARYFEPRDDLGRFAAMLVLFAGAMLLLTAADNVFVLFLAWELTSITSYLLIGFKDQEVASRAAALQALLVTGMGGLALLGGLVVIGQAAGTFALSGIVAAAPSGGGVGVALGLVLVGAMTKSAQTPFHFWLPGAMAAPTPVSAYLHSATMVKAGIYLIARLSPPFADVVGWWQPALLAIGTASMLVGGYRALRSTDLKSLLAFGTVSQLGLMVVLFGVGEPAMVHAGVAVLLAHALFKAALFMTVGVLDHQAGTRDLRRLSGVGRRMPITVAAMAVATASMAGVLPLLGFVAKEAAIEAALHSGLGWVVATAIVAGAVLTTAYGIRLVWGAFAVKADDVLIQGAVDADTVPRPARALEMPAVVLVVATVAFGVGVALLDGLVGTAAASLTADAGSLHLKLWHGFGAPLYLSLTALAGGVLAFRFPRILGSLTAVTSRAPDTNDMYRRSLFALNRIADRTTSIVQPGSLPVYLGMILATLVILPGVVFVRSASVTFDAPIAESPLQLGLAAVVIAAALATAGMRRRVSAVLMLGAVGYGVAALFVVQGAPDLALTQLLVETLALAIFVLVLRRLPERFEQPAWRLGREFRLALSLAVGVFIGAFAYVAAGARVGDTGAADYLSRALPDGGGKNVVNVILTDFRALDTIGEITVLVVASIGVISLVRGIRTGDDDGEAGS